MKHFSSYWAALLLCFLLLVAGTTAALANGTEQLGPPQGITIATGSTLAAAGTGMVDQPGTIDLTLPDNAVIKQVLLYWEGQMSTNVAGDNTIRVNGTTVVTGNLIGGPTRFFSGAFSSAFRADITSLGVVSPGYNEIELDQLSFTKVANGAGLIVIYEDGTSSAVIDLRDGVDLAYIGFPEPRRSTVAQTFTFAPSGVDRVATFTYFASSVAGAVSGNGARPESLELTVDNGQPQRFPNELNSWDGDEWDTKTNSVLIPAGATSLTAQLFSRDDLNTGNTPSSLTWIAGALNLKPPTPGLQIEKLTNGADADGANDADVPVINPGDPVTWTYEVTNIGSIPFREDELAISDDLVGIVNTLPITRIGNMDEVLAPGETWIYQATGVAETLAANPPNVTIVTGCDAGGTRPSRPTYENIGTVVGENDLAGTVTDSDPSHYCNPAVATPAIDIEKATNGEDADLPTGPQIPVGGTVNWTYVVTNVGDQDLVNVTVTDDQGVTVTCPQTTLAVGASMTCTATGTAVAGQYANIGSVVGTPVGGGNQVTDSDPSHYFGLLLNPAIDIEKATNGEDADLPTGPQIPVGGTVNWTYVVTNIGNQDLANVTVTDDQGVTVTCPQTTLAVGASMTCTATGTAIEGQYANIGSVVGTPVGGGNQVTDNDPSHYFGYIPAAVGNFVFGDINPNGTTPQEIGQGNGLQDGDPREQGIDGIIVELYTIDNTLVATTTTTNGGEYLFDNLPPGEYYLIFINPLGEGIWTEPNVGGAPNDAIDSDPFTPETDPRGDALRTESFTLTSGQTDLTWDAGLVGLSGTASAAVGDRVWNDANRNGIQDQGEAGIPGVTVRLLTTGGTVLETTVTNDQGIYNFSNLDPGSYIIEFVTPGNLRVTDLQVGGNDDVDSDCDLTTGRTRSFSLIDFETNLRFDCGLFTPTSLDPDEEPLQNKFFLPLVNGS